MTSFNRFGEPEMSDAELFRIMRRALSKPPRLVLSKSIAAAGLSLSPKKLKKPEKPAPLVVVRTQQEPSDRELLGAISDACARGWITGTDALAAQRLLEQGQSLPKSVRAAILGRGCK